MKIPPFLLFIETVMVVSAVAVEAPISRALPGSTTDAPSVSESRVPSFFALSWRVNDGIPADQVVDALRRRNGFVWLATANGAARFDGERFEVFRKRMYPELPNDRIETLFEDSSGNLFLGHLSGDVSVRLHDGFRSLDVPPEWTSEVVGFEEGNDSVWALDARGNRLLLAEDGEVFAGRCSMYPPSEQDAPNSLKNWEIRDMKVFVRQESAWREWGEAPFSMQDGGVCSLELENGDLAVGSKHGGLFILKRDGRVIRIRIAEGLSSNTVLCLEEDEDNETLWVGTVAGLSMVQRTLVAHHEFSRFKPYEMLSCIAAGSDGEIYLGTNKGRLIKGNSNVPVFESVFGRRKEKAVRSILIDENEGVWFSGERQYLRQLSKGGELNPLVERSVDDVWAMALRSDNEVWTGGEDGLWGLRDETWRLILSPQVGIADIRCLVQAPDGRLFIGMKSNGLAVRRPDGSVQFYDYFSGSDVLSLFWDDELGLLWVGTGGDGLALVQPEGVVPVPLSVGFIYRILADRNGKLWMVTEKGIKIADPQVLLDSAVTGEQGTPLISLDRSDGVLPSVTTELSLSAACSADDGYMWFISDRSIMRVDPDDVGQAGSVPLLIRQLRVNKTILPVNGIERLKLPPGVDRLDIEFSALNFRPQSPLRFRYRLVGIDQEWGESAGDRRMIGYQRIPPGDYRFELLAANRDGVWNTSPVTMDLEVKAFWWESWWFRVSIYLFGAALLVLITMGVLEKINRKKMIRMKQMSAVETERNRIAMDIHDEIGSAVTRIVMLCHRLSGVNDERRSIQASPLLEELQRISNGLVRSLDQTVWVVRPKNDTMNSLVMYLSKYIAEMAKEAGLQYDLDVPFDVISYPVPGPVRHNLLLAVKEAMNNIIKHSEATQVYFSIRQSELGYSFVLQDDGLGITDTQRNKPFQRGLAGMRRRMDDVDGEFSVVANENGGTTVKFMLPVRGWQEEKI